MVDRSETKSSKKRLNSSLPRLVNSHSARSHMPIATWTNPLIQSAFERQRGARRITTHGISSRTINLDPNRSRPLGNTSERSLIQTDEGNQNIFSSYSMKNGKRRHTTQVHDETRIQELNVPTILPRVEINDERSAQVTWAHQEASKINENLSESDQQDDRIESSNQSYAYIEERLACEITMSYASTTTDKSDREEIVVMQRYSTGETSLVYQGYLNKGESFSFKSQRRPTSSLSLAFYVEGSFDNETNECCEFKCIQNNSNENQEKKFLFKDIQKANPCQKCRKDYEDQLIMNNQKNTLVVKRNKSQGKSIITSKNEKPVPTDAHHTGLDILTSTIPIETDKSITQSSLIPTNETPVVPSTNQTSSDNPQDSNKSLSTTVNGIDLEAIMQLMSVHSQQRMKRHPQSVENFCYILENSLPISDDEKQILRGLINLGFTFDDINSKESIEFLKKIFNERIILIISKSSMENLSKPIQDESQLSAIYLIDSSQNNSFHSKFYRGSFPDINTLSKQLENDLQLLTSDLTTISSIPFDYSKMSTLNYVQALKDIILENDEKKDLKKEMIDFCREEYSQNIIQLKFIEEFEKDFQSNDSIHWYLRQETFIYKMITRAFRILDPDILFKLRYFIQHLHSKLNSNINTNTFTVYRTLRIQNKLFHKMKENQGSILSFNEFIFLNKTPSTIEPSPLNMDSKLVHFQIVLGNGVSTYDIENEVLLTIGTIFRIDKVEEINQFTFNVKLTTNDQILKAGQVITTSLRDAVSAPFPLVRMIKLMKQRELTNYIEYFSLILIDDPQAMEDETSNLILGSSLHYLGNHYYQTKQYEQALNYFNNSLKVYLRVLPSNDVRLTPTYNNIGSIYHKQDLNEQALEYHLKAYQIQKNSKDPDMDSISAYVGNIASVIMKLGRYKEAIIYLELDLQIKQKIHSNNNHPDIAVKYHNLAAAQYRIHQYEEALRNYEKCLQIELKCHSDEKATVAVTYYNMATTLEELGRLQEAKEAVENAIKRLLLTKNEDDEQIQMYKKYIQRLEQKIWMKNVFSNK